MKQLVQTIQTYLGFDPAFEPRFKECAMHTQGGEGKRLRIHRRGVQLLVFVKNADVVRVEPYFYPCIPGAQDNALGIARAAREHGYAVKDAEALAEPENPTLEELDRMTGGDQ